MNEEYKDLLPAGGAGVGGIQRDAGGETVSCEAAGDYTLPDYQPEIRRILMIRTAVLPSAQYVGQSRAEFSGTVAHTVFYADGEGKLATVTLDTPYEFSLTLPAEGEYTAFADSMAEATSCRLGGPRKISLRTRVRSLVHLFYQDSVTPEIRGMGSREDEKSLELLQKKISVGQVRCAASDELSLFSAVRTEAVMGEEARCLFAGGSLLISECRPKDGGCAVRGDAWVRALLDDGNGTPCVVKEKIPFEVFLPMEGVSEGDGCVAQGRVLSCDVQLTPADEAGTAVAFDVVCEVEALAAGRKIVDVTADLYSTAYEMTCHHRTVAYPLPMGATMGNYTVSGTEKRGEDAEEAATVIDTDGRLDIHGVTVEHGRATVGGSLTATVILAGPPREENATPHLFSVELPIPFRIETDLRPEAGHALRYACHGELISARARLEVDCVAVDAEIALSLRAFEEQELRLLAEAEPDRSVSVEHGGNRVFVVYPQEGDTLFSLGARYHKSRAALAERNGLPPEALAISDMTHSLDGVHHLLMED